MKNIKNKIFLGISILLLILALTGCTYLDAEEPTGNAAKKLKYECTSNADCQAHYICDNGKCVADMNDTYHHF